MALGSPSLHHLGLVFLGGTVGAVTRVGFATWFPVTVGAYPWTTFAENVSGAFLLAVVLTVMAVRRSLDPTVRLLVGTGALGAFTTYSTLAVEAVDLLATGHLRTAALYSVGSLLAGILAALAGIAVGQRLGGGRIGTAGDGAA